MSEPSITSLPLVSHRAPAVSVSQGIGGFKNCVLCVVGGSIVVAADCDATYRHIVDVDNGGGGIAGLVIEVNLVPTIRTSLAG